MRPPQKTGENLYASSIIGWLRRASMRPPQKTGENRLAMDRHAANQELQ